MLPSLGATLDFIMKAHAGQKDKGGFPYYLHPEQRDIVKRYERSKAILRPKIEQLTATLII